MGSTFRWTNQDVRVNDTQRRIVIALLVLAALGEATYWTTFFGTDALRFPGVACFRTFDLSFPAANAWTTIAALLGATGLWRRAPSGVLFGIVCGSSLMYLGLVDVVFFTQNGLYAQPDPAIYGEMAVHATCFTVAPAVVWWLWRNRRGLGV
ncbi:MAG: hypothetical protein U0Q55_16280 [Vicinamibacterales bacterium]